jgi:hypothetical protein
VKAKTDALILLVPARKISGTRFGSKLTKPRVLAAFPPFAQETVRHLLDDDVELKSVATLQEAREALGVDDAIVLALCGVHFDESRMYDLLRYVRATYPALPFLCCRVLDSEIPQISREAIRIAAEALGATFFIDLPSLRKQLGAPEGEQRFRALVLGTLGIRSVGKSA